MIEKINNMLDEISNEYHTKGLKILIGTEYNMMDNLTLFAVVGGTYFLKKTFNSVDKCYNFIIKKYSELKELRYDMENVNDYYQINKTLEGCYYISQEYGDKLKKTFELV